MNWLDGALESIRADEPDVKVYVEWYRRSGVAVLSLLRVPEARQGQGVMRRVVSTLVESADSAGVILAVSPTDEWGADRERLRRFYESFGFVRNAGEHRDWQCKEDYIRPAGG